MDLKNFFMRVLFILFGITFFVSCQQLTESDTISKELSILSKKNSCQIGFLDQKIDQTTELVLKLNCTPKSEFIAGKILLEGCRLLDKKNVKRDYCSIVSSDNQSLAKIKWEDHIEIYNKKKAFEKHFRLLLESDRKEIEKSLHESINEKLTSQLWYDRMFEMMKTKKTKWDFEGVAIKKQNSETYLLFGKRLQNEVIIWMSYKFSKENKIISDNKIYGIGVIPL